MFGFRLGNGPFQTTTVARLIGCLFVWSLAISLGAAPFLGLFSPIRFLPNVASTPVVPLNEEEEKTSSSSLPFGEKIRRQMGLVVSSERFVVVPRDRQLSREALTYSPWRQDSCARWNNCLHSGQRLPMRC